MSLHNTVDDQELLYRGVHDVFWDYNKNRPSSAIFKDSNGVSVDRCNGREETDCVAFLRQNISSNKIISIFAGAVRELQAYIKYAPIDGNHYHCEIYNSSDLEKIGTKKARRLRDRIVNMYID